MQLRGITPQEYWSEVKASERHVRAKNQPLERKRQTDEQAFAMLYGTDTYATAWQDAASSSTHVPTFKMSDECFFAFDGELESYLKAPAECQGMVLSTFLFWINIAKT